MNLLKIKNLVIRNIKPLASSVCLIGLTAVAMTSFKNYGSNEPIPITNNMDISKKKQDELLEQFITESKEFIYKAPVLTEEQIKENYNSNYKTSFDLDDMLLDAHIRKEELLKQKEQEYIDNLITIYEYGYDDVNDTYINTDSFELTTDNKTYENLAEEDFELFVACVAAECNGTTHDALATASSILNRCDSKRWSTVSEEPTGHLTASGQYSVYSSGLYKQFLNFNVTDEVLNACTAVWYNGVRNNDYCSFRGNSETEYSDNQVVDGGNRFDDKLTEDDKKKTLGK